MSAKLIRKQYQAPIQAHSLSIFAPLKQIVMLRMVLALTGLFFISILSAQVCGTPQETLLTRVDINKASSEAHQRSAQKYIPITFHLVALTNGSGRVKEEDIFKQLANLNEQYSDQQAVFYLDHLNYFDNDAVYNEPASTPAITQMRLRRDNNSMNIFITGLAESGSGSPGVTLAYYEPNEEFLVGLRSSSMITWMKPVTPSVEESRSWFS